MRWKFLVAAAAVTTFMLAGYTGAAGAANGTRYVGYDQLRDGNPKADTPNLWYRTDTRTGGGVNLTTDFGAPEGFGGSALALTTNQRTTAKAQLYNTAPGGALLGSVTTLDYQTFHAGDMTGFEEGAPALQLVIDYNGEADGGFATLTYEPYVNGHDIVEDVWQPWATTEEQWYSSRAFTCGAFSITATQGSDTASLSEIGDACDTAVVGALGVNIGSNNPNYITGVDGLHLVSAQDDLTWNFEAK